MKLIGASILLALSGYASATSLPVEYTDLIADGRVVRFSCLYDPASRKCINELPSFQITLASSNSSCKEGYGDGFYGSFVHGEWEPQVCVSGADIYEATLLSPGKMSVLLCMSQGLNHAEVVGFRRGFNESGDPAAQWMFKCSISPWNDLGAYQE